jgi:hypothetical protein
MLNADGTVEEVPTDEKEYAAYIERCRKEILKE